MKIVVFSDTHLGYCPEMREKEAEENFEKAARLSLELKPDFVLMAGDIFDTREPSQETISRAIDLFKIFWREKSDVEILREGRKEDYPGVPVITIHGTHERRLPGYTNVLEILEKAGLVFYLREEKNKISVKKDGEVVFIFGFSGVPEEFALKTLRELNPKPEGTHNIFVFHQNIKQFLPSEVPGFSLEDLPAGFDLYVDGHLHSPTHKKLNEKSILLITGSTIVTQVRDSENEKGVWLYDTETKNLEFFKLPGQRKLFVKTLEFHNATKAEILREVEDFIRKNLQKPVPIIRIRLRGSLEKGLREKDIVFSHVVEKYKGKAIINIESEFEDLKIKIKELRLSQQEKLSISKLGVRLLGERLKETNFNLDAEKLFTVLQDKKPDKNLEFILKESKKKEVEKK